MEQKKTEKPIAVSGKELNKFGCPYCGYRSGYTPVRGGGSAIWTCGDSNCGKSCVFLSDGVTKSSIGLSSGDGDEVIYPELQVHPRRGIPSHGKPDKKPEGGGEFFWSRGIGTDHTPGCFVCGGKFGMHKNIAAFVQCKTAGERVVAMFKQGARIDYREHEPDRVQVKIGACATHITNLEYLNKLTAAGNKDVLAQEMVRAAVAM